MFDRDELIKQVSSVLNGLSRENASDTPDFILATVMVDALEAFDEGVRERESWYGRSTQQSEE